MGQTTTQECPLKRKMVFCYLVPRHGAISIGMTTAAKTGTPL